MAINITRVHGYILDKTDNLGNDYRVIYGKKYDRYFRWIDPKLMLTPLWYGIMDNGELSGISYNSKKLEQEFQEANGFLEQLELF